MSVIELALLRAKPGRGDDLGAALPKALDVIGGVEGCVAVACLRCVERPDEFLARVEWTVVEAHQAFQQGPDLKRFQAPIAEHYDGASALGHFTEM